MREVDGGRREGSTAMCSRFSCIPSIVRGILFFTGVGFATASGVHGQESSYEYEEILRQTTQYTFRILTFGGRTYVLVSCKTTARCNPLGAPPSGRPVREGYFGLLLPSEFTCGPGNSGRTPGPSRVLATDLEGHPLQSALGAVQFVSDQSLVQRLNLAAKNPYPQTHSWFTFRSDNFPRAQGLEPIVFSLTALWDEGSTFCPELCPALLSNTLALFGHIPEGNETVIPLCAQSCFLLPVPALDWLGASALLVLVSGAAASALRKCQRRLATAA
jgi:hypothetical protein